MSAPCERLARRLPAAVDGPEALDDEDRDHVAQCLRCQAAVAQHRRIRRTLHGLDAGRPPVDRIDTVLGALDAQVARRRRAVRRGVVLGMATVTAIGIGVAFRLPARRSA